MLNGAALTSADIDKKTACTPKNLFCVCFSSKNQLVRRNLGALGFRMPLLFAQLAFLSILLGLYLQTIAQAAFLSSDKGGASFREFSVALV